MQYFRIKNYSKYQHFKNRGSVPWIKVYRAILRDYEFCQLTDIQKGHWLMILLLASEKLEPDLSRPPTEGQQQLNTHRALPYDPSYVRRAINSTSRVNLNVFLDKGFIELIDIKVISQGDKKGSSEVQKTEDRNTEVQKEKKQSRVFDFDSVWKEYPERKGKKQAERHFRASVKTDADLTALHTALEKYKAQVKANRDSGWSRPWMNGSTWFNQWQDWVEHEVDAQGEDISLRDYLERAKANDLH